MAQLDPVINLPFLYVNGLGISNDATNPNTVLDVAAGQARDSQNIIDMNLGNWLSQGLSTGTANSVTLLNFAVNGANGLDTGTFAASSSYFVYIVGDSSNKHPVAVMASLTAIPVLPFGYDSYRLIGFVQSDSSTHLLASSTFSNGNTLDVAYATPVALTVPSSGTSTTYVAMNLGAAAPVGSRVTMGYTFTPAAAGNTLNFTPTGATTNAVTITATGTTAQTGTFSIIPATVAGVPEVSYKVSAGTLTAATVTGVTMQI